MNSREKTRYMRTYQARRRGSTSYKTMVEDLQVLLALESGDLSQGQTAKLLGCDPLEVRLRREAAIEAGLAQWDAFRA